MREALGGGRSDLVLAHFVEQISDDDTAALRKVLRRMKTRNARTEQPGTEVAE